MKTYRPSPEPHPAISSYKAASADADQALFLMENSYPATHKQREAPVILEGGRRGFLAG